MRALAYALLLSAPVQAFARAGGAGGGSHSNNGGGGGDGGFIIDLIFILLRSGPIGWVVLFVIAFIAYKVIQAQGNGSGGVTIPESHYSHSEMPLARAGISNSMAFVEMFPEEKPQEFLDKVSKAFLTIQQSWSEQNLSHMRRFITDGVYRRFNAQFTMMKLLGQSNPISDVLIHGAEIAKVRHDGGYDCVDVMIRATASDQFVCEKFPQLNSPGGNEEFTEFWTFVRRADCRPGKDIFHNENCPQCAAPLTAKLMETARCPYCGSYLNSGEWDWVLAEITQSDDYGISLSLGADAPAREEWSGVRALDPGFCGSLLEDKATNAFMEILIGTATGQKELVKRFTTDAAYADLAQFWPASRTAFDRLYTRVVELLSVSASGTNATAYVGIRYAFHLIDLGTMALTSDSGEQCSEVKILELTRDYSGGAPKGSVYAGSCPHCGAPQKDALTPVCDHCGGPLNDAKLDWIVSAVMDPAECRAKLDRAAPDVRPA
jgi:predicted lipid-binding transport protein (Tim44 family)